MGTAIAATIPTTPAEGDTARDAVSRHLGLVYHVARSLTRSRGINLELDELVSAGTLGLIEALANFDASRGLAFTTFAAPRIRGAMLDELRRLDHVPRSVRRRARAVAAATDSLTGELGAMPDDSQLASRLGIDRETLWRWQYDGEAAHAMPLEHTSSDSDGNGIVEQDLDASGRSDVDDALTREEELIALQAAIRALGSRERTVLALYYYEELRLHQIAEVLGVTESRVSQIRTRAIARLREQLVSLREVAATGRS
jgi:RNA polymerase sigma factor for flagellar operon FliA